jgi:hypothetical protein
MSYNAFLCDKSHKCNSQGLFVTVIAVELLLINVSF